MSKVTRRLAGVLFSRGETLNIQIAVISLRAEDVSAAIHFYRDVIGLPLQHHSGADRPHFDLGGAALTIIRGRPALPSDAEPRYPVVAFSVPDLDQAVERLTVHGVALPWGVETNASGKWAMFHDPAGNLIELVEFNPASRRMLFTQ